MLLNVLNFFIVYCEKAAQNYYQLSKELYSARVFVKRLHKFYFQVSAFAEISLSRET